MTTLLNLAERVEAASGADMTLDALITIALNPERQTIIGNEPGRFPQKPIYGPVTEFIEMAEANGLDTALYLGAPAYTASLDAAMTLCVPQFDKYGGHAGLLIKAMDRLAKHFFVNSRPENLNWPEWLARYFTAACLRALAQEKANG